MFFACCKLCELINICIGLNSDGEDQLVLAPFDKCDITKYNLPSGGWSPIQVFINTNTPHLLSYFQYVSLLICNIFIVDQKRDI